MHDGAWESRAGQTIGTLAPVPRFRPFFSGPDREKPQSLQGIYALMRHKRATMSHPRHGPPLECRVNAAFHPVATRIAPVTASLFARLSAPTVRGAGVALIGAVAACASLETPSSEGSDAYIAGVEAIAAAEDAAPRDTVTGHVFQDRNRDGRRQEGEPGVRGVLVSNGVAVVKTDRDGAYTLPARDDMAVFVIQPSGWRSPTNADWVPQIAYQHKPAGSPKPLRYGGLAPTGPLPAAINFPLIRAGDQKAFACAVLGDTQAYANAEIGYLRDSVVDDMLDRGPGAVDCVIAVGDVMGDDLDLIPRMADVLGALEAPQWWVHGNHDFDFDADHDADSADSWRRLWGPAYYAFEMGEVLFIVLDNVVYPCGATDAQTPGREFCIDNPRKRYNARITDDQMAFVANLLALTDEDRTIVLAHHIPFVSFVDQTTAPHQTDNVTALYALLEGREALSLSGHTHTISNFAPGDSYAGWKAQVGVEQLPFRHIIAGAGSGAWYQGDFDMHGVPMALQRQGAPRGWLELAFDGNAYVERYHGANVGRERVMWTAINTPGFRSWFDAIVEWANADRDTRDPIPPLNIHDLPDTKILTPSDLTLGSFLTANVWAGDSQTTVTAQINDGPAAPMTRTQQAAGEGALIGALYADPFAAQRQLSVARFAMQSRSGEARNQGYEVWQGAQFGPAAPQPQRAIADRSAHLWRMALPADLPDGVHVATITVTDRHGRVFTDRLAFEVRAEHPPARWRQDVWERFENGPPVRD